MSSSGAAEPNSDTPRAPTSAPPTCPAQEREKENSTTIESQKKKLSRQRDILSSLKQRYAETDRRYRDENMRLTDEYKRITEQFKDLQSKFRHFELVDTKKYKEVRHGGGLAGAARRRLGSRPWRSRARSQL